MKKILIRLFDAAIFGLAGAFVFLLIFDPAALKKHRITTASTPGTLIQKAASQPARKTLNTLSFAAAIEQASPSVVNIYTTKIIQRRLNPLLNDPFFQRFFGINPDLYQQQKQSSLGSGVIVSEKGYVLTNYHVIADADEILVALGDGRSDSARIVGVDTETDLAVLKLSLGRLPAITFGDSDAIRVGDLALAIGNPFGVGQTVTMGIISALGRHHLGINTYENFIQTDAAINPGNSGGALVNSNGELIGINTAIISKSGGSQGIGLAIPANLAANIMTQIVKHGKVLRGWLGIEVQDLTAELAESFGLDSIKGTLIAGVQAHSPAYEMGLLPGDIITAINGEEV
ncbi:MAG: transcriptional regulator, partial [Gammaproteobacteria bacterium]